MRIKKFVGATIKEATEQMKQELGPEAIILNTKKISNGKHFNFLGKEMLEVTGAIDDQPAQRPVAVPVGGDENGFNGLLQRAAVASVKEPTASDTLEGLKNIAERFEKRGVKVDDNKPLLSAERVEINDLRTEMEEMKSALESIAEHFKYSKMPALPPNLQQAYRILVQNDVDEQLSADLVQVVYGKLDSPQRDNKQAIERCLLAEIAGLLTTAQPPKEKSKRPRIIALVGATGVGKTTTIAKLAAIGKLVQHLNIGLISADTYRIGAIEQLRTFASIADIPMEVVYKASEMSAALKKFSTKDVVFVDTVGRNQRMKTELGELKKLIQSLDPDEIHLVLSAPTNKRTMFDVIEKFGALKPNRIILSKVDEAVALGAMLNITLHTRLPISFVTTGQGVPDDIMLADSEKLARMIFPGTLAHA